MNRGLFGPFSGRFPGGAQGITPLFETTVVLALTSYHQISHNLNFMPKLWDIWVRPVSIDAGWGTSFEFPIKAFETFDGANYAPFVPYISTSVMGVGYAATSVHMTSAAGVLKTAIVPGNWRLMYRIFG
jgi:hypothetical protein